MVLSLLRWDKIARPKLWGRPRHSSPRKDKLSVWLACNNYVPTLSLMYHHNLAPNGVCPCRNTHEEPFIHCVRDCPLDFSSIKFLYKLDPISLLRKGLSWINANIFVAGVLWSWRKCNTSYFSNSPLHLYWLTMEARNMTSTFISYFPHSQLERHEDRW